MTFAIKFRKIQEFKQQGWTPACPTGRPECNKKAIISESVTSLYLDIPCSSSSLIYPQQPCLYHSALPPFLLFVTHVVFPGGCCSVTPVCLTFNPMHCSTPGFPVSGPSPGVCSSSCPLNWWRHPTISSSVTPFSSWLTLY